MDSPAPGASAGARGFAPTAAPGDALMTSNDDSNKKNLVLFFVISFLMLFGTPWLMEQFGFLPKPRPRPPAPVAEADPEPRDPTELAIERLFNNPFQQEIGPAVAPAPEGPPPVAPAQLVLGSDVPGNPQNYRFLLQIDQRGAAVEEARSALYEFERESRDKLKRQLTLVRAIDAAPAPLGLDIIEVNNEGIESGKPRVELGDRRWAVAEGGVVNGPEGQQSLTFTTLIEDETLGTVPVRVSKTYHLRPDVDGFEVELKFESDRDARLTYRLQAPYGLPIEGAWYATTFRDFVFGGQYGSTASIETRTAYDVDWYYARGRDYEERFVALPLAFVGIENRYFTTHLGPKVIGSDDTRIDAETSAVVHLSAADKTRSQIGAAVTSRPFDVGPNRPVTHAWRVYLGPKSKDALAAFGPPGVEELSSFRSGVPIPFASSLAKYVISPTLNRIHDFTAWVGGGRGNYGVAIILLTCLIRLMLFPLSRKQAAMAKKMQDLQPFMKEIQDKYRKGRQLNELDQEDRIAMQRDMWALQKRHNVSVVGAGCLPALIQLPILVGLWQALNNAVELRMAPFLYISNLAAPDMLFPWPGGYSLPLLGPYFNFLPILVVVLMLVQTKLFTPPPTTPEAEMQQKMFKYMMIIMAVMFYKVPSGLGVYFITSSAWQIGERLLVNWLARRNPVDLHAIERRARENPEPPKLGFFGRLMEAAAQEQTVRNNAAKDDSLKGLIAKARGTDPQSNPQRKPTPTYGQDVSREVRRQAKKHGGKGNKGGGR